MIVRPWLHDALRRSHPERESRLHLQAAMEWLCRAHDAAGKGGVARSYSLRFRQTHQRRGWLPAYPETTGYIIPTFLEYATQTGQPEYRDRALQMAQWEIQVQMDSGAVQGGVIGFPPTPAVFNTGQVLFGWSRAFEETGEESFRKAAARAANFLVDAQDPDGAWRRHGSRYARAGINVYDARTALGLVLAANVTGDARHRDAAVRNLQFALTRQLPNGWFPDCCLDDNERPLLHTLAYTMEGLLEAGVHLGEARFIAAARQAADAVLADQRADGGLPGRFDRDWRPAARWSCLTGDGQVALVWLRLFELTAAERYLDAAARALGYLKRTQDLTSTDPGVRGGIKGSQPLWGDYAAYDYPNWAAKFFADALMVEARLQAGRPVPA
jgi:hypothetical protein